MSNREGACARCWELPVVENRDLGGRYRELVLRAPELAARMRPGQFVNVRVADGLDPFLRRPFSVYRMDARAGTLSLLYDVVGRGTGLMARWEPGDRADVLAPLGNWFQVPAGEGPLALVAGGIGVAPLVALAESLAPSRRPLHALLGARTAEMLLRKEDFHALGAAVDVATDDGSRGYHGRVGELLQSLLDAGRRYDLVIACGPRAMMAATSRVARDAGIPCLVSMEVGMACGFGVCMGCAWRVADLRLPETGSGTPAAGCAGEPDAGQSQIADPQSQIHYRLVCTDGPVFDAAEIVWDE